MPQQYLNLIVIRLPIIISAYKPKAKPSVLKDKNKASTSRYLISNRCHIEKPEVKPLRQRLYYPVQRV